MQTKLKCLSMICIIGWVFGSASPVAAAEVKVFSAGAVSAVISRLADDFHAQTGHDVKITVGTVGQIMDRIAAGETADVVLVTAESLEDLVKRGKVIAGSTAEVGKVGVGVAVQEGASLPDISTAAAFRQTLLDAKSLVYADPAKGASSGIYFASVLKKLGIADAVKDKSTLLPGGFVVELVAEGKAEIGIHQITEIVPVKGVTLVGPLPAELQKVTTYSGGVMTTAVDRDKAALFLGFITSPETTPIYKALGFGIF